MQSFNIRASCTAGDGVAGYRSRIAVCILIQRIVPEAYCCMDFVCYLFVTMTPYCQTTPPSTVCYHHLMEAVTVAAESANQHGGCHLGRESFVPVKSARAAKQRYPKVWRRILNQF